MHSGWEQTKTRMKSSYITMTDWSNKIIFTEKFKVKELKQFKRFPSEINSHNFLNKIDINFPRIYLNTADKNKLND